MEDKKAKDHLKPLLYGMVNQMAEREDTDFVEDLKSTHSQSLSKLN